jgi:hypothetical protein
MKHRLGHHLGGRPVTCRMGVDASKIVFRISEKNIQMGNLDVVSKRSRLPGHVARTVKKGLHIG